MLTRDLRRKPGRQRPSIASAHALEPRQEVARQRLNVADPMRVQERFDAIGVGSALFQKALAFAARALVVLLRRARHVHYGAGFGLAAKVGEKGAHQALEVDAVGLGPARPPVMRAGFGDKHLVSRAKRINGNGCSGLRNEIALQPRQEN